MSTDYNYDEEAQFFPFFILTLTGLVTLPLTYFLLKPSKDLENTAPRIKTDFKPEDNDLIQGQKKKQWRRERKLKRIIATITGYAVMGWMIYLIVVTQRLTPKIWDPYSILNISRSASEKAIKKHYRKLSLQFHPDKVQLAVNQTMDEVTARYVEISKAYKALTDDEVRNNYLQYGHPDGKQSFSIGIALPKGMIADGSGKYVILAYALLLGVLLPYVVGKWWYGTQRVTKEKVLISSAGKLFREYQENISTNGVVAALTHGDEYKAALKGNKADSGTGKIEKAILAQGEGSKTAAGLTEKDSDKVKDLEGLRRKTLGLLWAYLGRVKLGDAVLDDEKFEIAPIAAALNEAFISICLAYGPVGPLLSAYRTSQNIIQAVTPDASPLLQLPHFTPSIAKTIDGADAKHHVSVQQFMALPEYERRKLATDQPGTLTPKQYNEAMSVARQLPSMKVEKAFFKCLGEKYIVTSSLVQFVVKARIIPPGTANVPEVKPADLEDLDPDEDDLDALVGRRPAKNTRVTKIDGTAIDREEVPPLAYAPYYPRDHPPRWHLLLAETKQHRVAVPPNTFTTLDKPIFDDAGKPTFNVQTLKLSFQAPPHPGSYTFFMHLVCDSYIGFDTKQEVTLVVEDSEKAVDIESEEEISEPDEDSLAGQMNALKTGGIAAATGPSKKKKSAAKKHESSDDESDTEGEVDSDDSETDTDTDSD